MLAHNAKRRAGSRCIRWFCRGLMLSTILLPGVMRQPTRPANAAAAPTAPPLPTPAALRQLRPATETMPARPWHTSFIDETAKTPEGQPNAGADGINFFMDAAFKGTLHTTAVGTKWQDFNGFLEWAVWAYLSPDSHYKGDQRLIPMMQTWLDTLFVRIETPPTDAKQAEKWTTDTLGAWKFEVYALPMIELQARPQLTEAVGAERVARYRTILLKNVDASMEPQNLDTILSRVDNMINFATHPFGLPLAGWMLTGDRKYWLLMENTIDGLGKKLLPDGMFSYQSDPADPAYREAEMPYYHTINIAALYMYWWTTGSQKAEDIMKRSVPYYPVNFEPPYYYNGGADIWWKDQWRPFWAHAAAMVAAATGDGENAAIADEMAKHRIEFDRYYLTLGAQAYQRMGLNHVAATKRRDNFIALSPDIRGLRTRFGHWSTTFTTGTFTFTRASAMLTNDTGKSYWEGLDAIHLARPYSRVAPMEVSPNIELDYGTLDKFATKFALAKGPDCAVFGSTYRLGLTPESWAETETRSKWLNHELWFTTPYGMVGLLDSDLTAPTRAREFSHQYRFIIANKKDAQLEAANLYHAGGLRFKVWATDFKNAIPERVRRYNQAPRDRSDWQLSLSDSARSPEQIIQGPKTDEATAAAVAPAEKYYAAGDHHYSLVEVSPWADGGFDKVISACQGTVLGIRSQKGKSQWLALYNSGEKAAPYRLPRDYKLQSTSWTAAATGKGTTLTLPAHGSALLNGANAVWDARVVPVAPRAATVATAPGTSVAASATAIIKPLVRHLKRINAVAKPAQYLEANFCLFNTECRYDINYLADNDWEAHAWTDHRQISAPYPPGLGFVSPNTSSWYYNGYLTVALDDLKVTDYAIKSIKQIASANGGARVDVSWDTPRGQVTLAFLLPAHGYAVLQQLSVLAAAPIERVTLTFRTFPAGYGKDRIFTASDASKREWAVMGREQGPANANQGCPSGLLVDPHQWDNYSTLLAGTAPRTLSKTVALAAGQVGSLNWALAVWPNLDNDGARAYMEAHSEAIAKALKTQFS